tara:strand:+ start:896 stop:1495 length:600 start_codon:yes stop_codon:yes gene_type:complete
MRVTRRQLRELIRETIENSSQDVTQPSLSIPDASEDEMKKIYSLARSIEIDRWDHKGQADMLASALGYSGESFSEDLWQHEFSLKNGKRLDLLKGKDIEIYIGAGDGYAIYISANGVPVFTGNDFEDMVAAHAVNKAGFTREEFWRNNMSEIAAYFDSLLDAMALIFTLAGTIDISNSTIQDLGLQDIVADARIIGKIK